jgi:hypothetical protein
MEGAGLITVGVLLIAGVLGLAFELLGFVLRALGLLAGRGRAPHELSRQRAAVAAFAGAFGVYLVQTGGWPLNQLPPWVPFALMIVAGVAVLLVLAGAVGARERDLSDVVVSLVIAVGGYALLKWQWYFAPNYLGADYVPAELINRLLQGVYIATVAAGLARALICLQPFGGRQQRQPYETARMRAAAAAFALVAALYVLCTGQWLGPLGAPAWTPTVLLVIATLSLLGLLSGFYGAYKFGVSDPHGIGVSLVVAAAAIVALWGRWQIPPGPAAEFVNRLLPGLYLAVLIAALTRALICARLLGASARRLIDWWQERRNRPMRAASSGSGFWAEMRESFERGRTGRS